MVLLLLVDLIVPIAHIVESLKLVKESSFLIQRRRLHLFLWRKLHLRMRRGECAGDGLSVRGLSEDTVARSPLSLESAIRHFMCIALLPWLAKRPAAAWWNACRCTQE
jgi:hypothetical protein